MIPEFLWELSLGIYAAVWGFRRDSPILSPPARSFEAPPVATWIFGQRPPPTRLDELADALGTHSHRPRQPLDVHIVA